MIPSCFSFWAINIFAPYWNVYSPLWWYCEKDTTFSFKCIWIFFCISFFRSVSGYDIFIWLPLQLKLKSHVVFFYCPTYWWDLFKSVQKSPFTVFLAQLLSPPFSFSTPYSICPFLPLLLTCFLLLLFYETHLFIWMTQWQSIRKRERLHLLIYCFTPKMTPVAKAVTNQRAWNFVWLSLQQEPNPTGLTSLPSQAHPWEAEQQAGQPEPEPALRFGMLVSQVTTYSAVLGCWSHLLLFFVNSFSPLVFIFLLLPVNVIIS